MVLEPSRHKPIRNLRVYTLRIHSNNSSVDVVCFVWVCDGKLTPCILSSADDDETNDDEDDDDYKWSHCL